MTREIILTVGVSGSLKSSWATSYVKSNPEWVIVNYDSIRKMLLPGIYPGPAYYDRKDVLKIEQLVVGIGKEIAIGALNIGKKVIIDNTNLKPSYLEGWINDLEPTGFSFKLFDVAPGVAKWRVYMRDFQKQALSYLTLKETTLSYIDKQLKQYEQIKQWLLDKYPEKIIT